MDTRTFEEAFNAVFHSSREFSDFLSCSSSEEVCLLEVGGRKVFRMSSRLKEYLRFIDRVLLRGLAIEQEVVHSFVKGKSALTAVSAHSNSRYFFVSDVEKFYQSISGEDVRRVLARETNQMRVSDFSKYLELLTQLTTLDGALPVGFSTSPALSNSFLYEFDCALKEFTQKAGLIYTRYADDIVVSGNEFDDVSGVGVVVQGFLDRYASVNMRLNYSKTKILKPGSKVKILGLVVLPNGRVTIDVKYKKKIESFIYFYISDKDRFDRCVLEEFKEGERSFFGLLHYAKSIDPLYIEKLQGKYGVYVIRKLMEDKWNAPR